jgi:hypothetical protein
LHPPTRRRHATPPPRTPTLTRIRFDVASVHAQLRSELQAVRSREEQQHLALTSARLVVQ